MARKKALPNPDLIRYYQLKISLSDCPLPIWRRMVMRADLPLQLVSEMFQCVMGWSGAHGHLFQAGGKLYSDEVEGSAKMLDETEYELGQLLKEAGEELVYIYDHGDEWRHRVVLEAIEGAEASFTARCLIGKRACPPEDVGGVVGYAEFLEVIEDPEHDEWLDKIEWLGCEFDPDSFDARLANLRIELIEQSLATFAEGLVTAGE